MENEIKNDKLETENVVRNFKQFFNLNDDHLVKYSTRTGDIHLKLFYKINSEPPLTQEELLEIENNPQVYSYSSLELNYDKFNNEQLQFLDDFLIKLKDEKVMNAFRKMLFDECDLISFRIKHRPHASTVYFLNNIFNKFNPNHKDYIQVRKD